MQSLNLYEKVIKGMELCRYDPDPGMPLKSEVSCDICPYWDDTYGCRMNDMFDDAIALLKAQEPVKPRIVDTSNSKLYHNDMFKNYYCGNCGEFLHVVNRKDLFCSQCGKAVKWE